MPLATNNCPAGSYCPTGSTSIQADCPPGFYCPPGSQNPTVCPRGYYCALKSATPTLCQPGTYCSEQSTYAHDCAAGTYCPDGINQLTCPTGTRSAPGSQSCSTSITVPNGSITNLGAIVCNPGFTLYNGLCYPLMRPSRPAFMNITNGMIVDTIDSNSTAVSMCPPCYSLSGFLCNFSNTCTPTCQTGYVPNYNKACVPCPIGYYSLGNVCVSVDDGYFSNAVGGEFPCPPGTWSNNSARVCTLCLAGTQSLQPHQTDISACVTCIPGTWSRAGSSKCINCPSGTHSTVSGATSNASCTICTIPSCAPNQYVYGCTNPQNFQITCNNCPVPTPGTLNYVSAPCTTNGPTIISSISSPITGNYYSSFDQGTYNRAAVPSNWVLSNCTCLSGCDYTNLYYVASSTNTCQNFTDTIVTKYPSCPTNQYYSDTSGAQSSYFSPATGSPPFKTCTNCLTISLAFPKYVSGSCSNISASTVSNVLPTTGYFYNGFNTGSAYVLGTPGSLTQCSLPGTSQWTTVACSNVSNTQFSTFTNVFSCSSNVTYFTKRSVSGDAYTLGANSICSNCLDYQWKSTCSPTNVSTALGMYNVKISGATGLSDPRSLASDLVSGNIYVANGADHTIYVGIPNGSGGYTQQLFFGTGSPAVLYNPIAIKYSSGYLYVYEQNSALSNLSKITTTVPITKTFLTRFPATSNTINEFAVRGGFLYLPDSKYANIWRVDTNTGITTQFIGPTNPINKPYSIYFDSTGSLFVADGGNYTIQKYNSSGVFQTNVYTGSSSTFIPRSISIDSNDNIIISNSIVAKIQILLQNGNLSNLVGGGSTFSSATAVGLGSSVKLGGYNSVGNIIRGTTIDSSGNVFFVSNVFTVSKIY